jgi:hypothetical protein
MPALQVASTFFDHMEASKTRSADFAGFAGLENGPQAMLVCYAVAKLADNQFEPPRLVARAEDWRPGEPTPYNIFGQ